VSNKSVDELYVQKTFLFVDDEPAACKVVKRMAGIYGVNVQTANSAAMALSFIEHDPSKYFLVLTDEIMPGMSGTDLLIEIEQQWPHIRRTLISGVDNPEVLEKGFEEAQIFRYLRKPMSEPELQSLIEDACEDFLTEQISIKKVAIRRSCMLSDMITEELPDNKLVAKLKKVPEDYRKKCQRAWKQAGLNHSAYGNPDSDDFEFQLEQHLRRCLTKLLPRLDVDPKAKYPEFKLSLSLRQFGIKGLRKADRFIKGDERLFVAMFATLKDYFVVLGHDISRMVSSSEDCLEIYLGGRFTYNDIYSSSLSGVEQGTEVACYLLEFMMLARLFGIVPTLDFNDKIMIRLDI